MNRWLLLAGAIVAEVCATLSLKLSVENPVWTVVVVAGYGAAFYLLALTLRAGLPIGVAYGIWGAVGVAAVALAGIAFFDETLSPTAITGIGVIIVGVVTVEIGARPQPEPAKQTELLES